MGEKTPITMPRITGNNIRPGGYDEEESYPYKSPSEKSVERHYNKIKKKSGALAVGPKWKALQVLKNKIRKI